MHRPSFKPINANFSSGPCAKRPNWNFSNLEDAALARSHRGSLAKDKLFKLIKLTKSILEIPDDYLVGIVPGSDTGAVEISLWNLLGLKPVTALVWESFGNDWAKDLSEQLKYQKLEIISVDYGSLPDLSCLNFDNDIIFNWNGTTSGVRVPNSDWISHTRNGLTICDATSAAFAMKIDWSKLDVATFSWQKCLGGEAGHGMLILSPSAVKRVNSFLPSWPIPKLFQLRKNNKLNYEIFKGSTINTPSMLCVEDFLDSLLWSKKIGGLDALISRSIKNLEVITDWVSSTPWIEFLAKEKENISSTSICLKFSEDFIKNFELKYINKIENYMVSILEKEGVAYDIGSYRSAPSGLRIWGGPTVESEDIKHLLKWLDWAYAKAIKDI